jgi:hypothetical protein
MPSSEVHPETGSGFLIGRGLVGEQPETAKTLQTSNITRLGEVWSCHDDTLARLDLTLVAAGQVPTRLASADEVIEMKRRASTCFSRKK